MVRLTRTVLALGLCAIAASCAACALLDPCGHEPKRDAVSPDGRYVAAVYEQNCGATTDYNTRVTIRDSRDSADPATQARVLLVHGTPEGDQEWLTKYRLSVVAFAAVAQPLLDKWKDVRIEHRHSWHTN